MKTYVFSPTNRAWEISYLTNGIDSNDRLFIYAMSSLKAGVFTNGIIDEGKLLGMPDDYLETTEHDFIALAKSLNLNLFSNMEGVTPATNLNNSLCEFLTFTIPTATDIVIDNTANTIVMNVPFGTAVTALVATFTTTNSATVKIGSTAQVSGTTANNFTSTVSYIVTAKDNTTTKTYVVTVTILSE